ncbi:MAG: PD40 domain-containing protein [Myxococcales bacterium]|nr:PD40 domain-containing protein [Myxococcales bacterium]
MIGLLALTAHAAPEGYYREPALHDDTLIFTAEGDLWRVGIEGGLARRLTSHTGVETRATISPDGTQVAFDASYEGPTEVYVMPVDGGAPKRLTWEGGPAVARGWTPDGRVIVSTSRRAGLPGWYLQLVDPNDGRTETVPLADASDGAWVGDTVVFTRYPFQGSHTKRYRGGTAQHLWRKGPADAEALAVAPDFDGTTRHAMAWGDRIVFESDLDGTMELWTSALDGTDRRQITTHEGFDVLGADVSGGKAAYQLGADLHVVDLASAEDRVVPITLSSDLDQTRERWIDDPMDFLTSAWPSPTGDRVALTARGQVFVAPSEDGRLVQVTRDSGVRWRNARFVDERTLIAVGDVGGELGFFRMPADGLGEPTRITTGERGFRPGGVPSPDGKWIAWGDRDHRLQVVEVATGKLRTIEENPIDTPFDLTWSPDSQWLAYASSARNQLAQVRLFRPGDGVKADVTSDRTPSTSPAFSPDGKWLYFVSERALDTDVGSPWGWFAPEPHHEKTTRVYAVALQPGQLWPWEARTETQPEADEPGDVEPKKKRRPRRKRKADDDAVRVNIQLEGLQARIEAVPLPEMDAGQLMLTDDALFWLQFEDGEASLMAARIADRDVEPVTVVKGVRAVSMTADREALLVRRGGRLHVVDAQPSPVDDLDEAAVDLSAWALSIDPRLEWRQMLIEAWRLERDWFFDRGMHGNDWDEVLERHLPLVDRVTDRDELADLMSMMVGELSALHTFVVPGDVRRGPEWVMPASLGADLERQDDGSWRVAALPLWDPERPEERPPLARTAADVRVGDVIEGIDGVPLSTVPDPSVLLRGKSGQQVRLRVRRGTAVRDVIVVAASPWRDRELRYRGWENERRARVEEQGEGRIGYVHLRAMGGDDYESWARDFYPVYDREGLIVDVRHNRGGNIDSWILERLMRKAWMYWQGRAGEPTWNMQYAFRGHVVVLTDAFTASDGEAFAEGFRRLGLGPVIGARTWGGEIWLSFANWLEDNGIASAAEFGVFGPEGEWLIEGTGVVPDIEVENLPAATFAGGDAQLDAAIAELQRRMAEEPIEIPTPPPGPDRSRGAWPE